MPIKEVHRIAVTAKNAEEESSKVDRNLVVVAQIEEDRAEKDSVHPLLR